METGVTRVLPTGGGNNRLSLDVLVEACEALLRPGHARAQPMTTIRRFVLRLVSFFRPGAAEADLSREIYSHLQLLEDEFVSKGMPRDEARLAARRAFGGVEQGSEERRVGKECLSVCRSRWSPYH